MTRMGNERGAWKLLVGKPEGKRPVSGTTVPKKLKWSKANAARWQ